VISLTKKHGYLLSQTGSVDQTPIWFDMLETTPIDHVGERSVQVTTTDADKYCDAANNTVGHRLPLFVIFRRKNSPKRQFPQELL
jgi:hypothetical protein